MAHQTHYTLGAPTHKIATLAKEVLEVEVPLTTVNEATQDLGKTLPNKNLHWGNSPAPSHLDAHSASTPTADK